MSKKTRKKTPDTASGRSASKNAGAKTGKPRTSAATKSRAPATKKASKKVPAAAKHVTTATRSKPKATATPVHMVATLEEGSPAPAFFLPRDGGQSVALTDYAGRKLVIFFYPRANTPGCTLEAADFSRNVSAFAASQTAVLGVSADPVKAQESFRDKHQLTVPLLSDETHAMLKAYGAWGQKSMYGKIFEGVLRTTVLIDPVGKILKIWRKVRVEGHADEVLAAARNP
jgi:peroxiredoxin Q/BCP